ncbi:T9SS type A sorting domain-containing protein [Rhodocaloribacter sp.]
MHRGLLILAFLLLVSLPARAQNAWINEFHYDNAGADTGEFVEVIIEDAGSFALSDFTVTLYNGNNSSVYGTHDLDTFTSGDVAAGFTVFSKLISGIQNGAPDGLALDYQGTLIEFICYEGTFTASGGVADGVTCTDVGVSESGSTPAGESLQRTGTGATGADFAWTGPSDDSPGAVNDGQTLAPAACSDPGTVPMWDGTITILPGGLGEVPMTSGVGFGAFALDLGASSNIALIDVRDAGGVSLPGYTGSGSITGSKNSGFERFDYTGAPGGEATEVKLIIGAPEEANSVFFLDVSDVCPTPRTLHVDPRLSLHAATTGTGEALPTAFALEPNYPNPFNPVTTIRFALPEASEVRLAVYDLLGREVSVLAEGPYPAGAHTVTWRADDAPSGVYLYRLEAGAFVSARRMLLIK